MSRFGFAQKPVLSLIGFMTVGAFCFSEAKAATKSHRKPAAVPAHVSYDRVITFKKGSSELTKADKDALGSLIQTVKDRSQKIEQIHVAAWSDKLQDDRALAESRMNAIQDHLEGELAQSYVETFNMAERSNWFARAMNANARDIKKMFSQKGAPQNVTPEDFAVVRSKGGLSKAVLLIELEPAMMTSKD